MSVKPLMADIVLVAAVRSGATFSYDDHIFCLTMCLLSWDYLDLNMSQFSGQLFSMGYKNKTIYLFVLSKQHGLTENTMIEVFILTFCNG